MKFFSNPFSLTTKAGGVYEFGGPLGVFAMLIGMPAFMYATYVFCYAEQCMVLNPLSYRFGTGLDLDLGMEGAVWWDWNVAAVFLGWFLFQIVLYYTMPGKVVDGSLLADGKTRLKYPINGFAGFLVSLVVVAGLVYSGLLQASFAYDHFLPFMSASIVFSFLMAAGLFIHSHAVYPTTAEQDGSPENAYPGKLAAGGQTGNSLYDYFIGRTLNPRVGALDLKYFCELRPGLILWVLIDFSMAAKEYELTGSVSYAMLLVCAFQFWYVADALWSETAILTTMDITTDGFGWMLVFGDLAWVPFVYSLQARFLVDYPADLSVVDALVILAIQMVGYYIFRSSNSQKNLFRSNPKHPSVKNLHYIQTQRGTRLLADGWWAMSRHMNYFGDLLMGLAWCLPTGFNRILPYFYAIYFVGLLVHREQRDEEKCRHKYGKDWEKYCEVAKWHIVPYVY